jgi:hypothetical protein
MWPEDTPRPDSNPFKFTYTIKKSEITDFVNSLHVLQEHYMDAAMEQKARDGFPEANEVISYIKALK